MILMERTSMGVERIRYYVEGECEKKLIGELKKAGLMPSGKIAVFNVLTQRISNSRLIELGKGSIIVFVFDTDGEQNISILKKNIRLLDEYVPNVKILKLVQVRNLEDELIRATNVKHIEELTNSKSASDFKSDFLRQKSCLSILNRHDFDISKMWCSCPEGAFADFSQDFSFLKKL